MYVRSIEKTYLSEFNVRSTSRRIVADDVGRVGSYESEDSLKTDGIQEVHHRELLHLNEKTRCGGPSKYGVAPSDSKGDQCRRDAP